MSTEEPKPESAPNGEAKIGAGSDGSSAPPGVDAAVAWPPPEAAPEGEAAKPADGESAKPAADGDDAKPADGKAAPPASPADSEIMTAPEPTAAVKPPGTAADDMPAATPGQEMGLSDSTLHWLEDGEQAVPGQITEPGTMPSYDPRAPVAGRRRAFLVVGGAGLIAVIVSGYFYAQ